jgi:fermentation-respiration switch protein FrsA (DUF1100 family)
MDLTDTNASLAEVFYGYKEINPIDVVGEIQCPIFFIHEQDDDLVSAADDVALDKASGNQIDVLREVDANPYFQTYPNHPGEYITKVSEFFNSALNGNGQ